MEKKLVKASIIAVSVIGAICLGVYTYNEILPSATLNKMGDITTVFSKTYYDYRLSYHNGEVTARVKSNSVKNDYRAKYSLTVAPKDILSIELLDKNGYPIKIISFDSNEINMVNGDLKAVKKVEMGAKEVLQVKDCTFTTRSALVKE